MSELKAKLTEDMKTAMRAKEKARLNTVRSILAAIKQKEVDTREEQSDEDVLAILTKQAKQRKESISQYDKAARDDLSAIEKEELAIIETYMPKQMDEAEVKVIVADVISQTGATGPKEMGKVMGQLTAKLKGKADMSQVSQLVKAALADS